MDNDKFYPEKKGTRGIIESRDAHNAVSIHLTMEGGSLNLDWRTLDSEEFRKYVLEIVREAVRRGELDCK